MTDLPAYMKASDDSPSKKGRKQEKKARLHINSGSVWFDRGDISIVEGDDKYLLDVKRTDGKTFQLNKEKVAKLFEIAMQQQKTPAYLVYFGDEFVVRCIVSRCPKSS